MREILTDSATMKNRMLGFNHKKLSNKTATEARTLIEKIDIKKLFAACPGAVTFFCWVKLNLLVYFQGYRIVSVRNAVLSQQQN